MSTTAYTVGIKRNYSHAQAVENLWPTTLPTASKEDMKYCTQLATLVEEAHQPTMTLIGFMLKKMLMESPSREPLAATLHVYLTKMVVMGTLPYNILIELDVPLQ